MMFCSKQSTIQFSNQIQSLAELYFLIQNNQPLKKYFQMQNQIINQLNKSFLDKEIERIENQRKNREEVKISNYQENYGLNCRNCKRSKGDYFQQWNQGKYECMKPERIVLFLNIEAQKLKLRNDQQDQKSECWKNAYHTVLNCYQNLSSKFDQQLNQKMKIFMDANQLQKTNSSMKQELDKLQKNFKRKLKDSENQLKDLIGDIEEKILRFGTKKLQYFIKQQLQNESLEEDEQRDEEEIEETEKIKRKLEIILKEYNSLEITQQDSRDQLKKMKKELINKRQEVKDKENQIEQLKKKQPREKLSQQQLETVAHIVEDNNPSPPKGK